MRMAWAAVAAALSAARAAAMDLSGEAGLVSDYRYRGVSLSRGRPAVQAELTLEHESGLYADLWGSTLGSSDPSDSEIDLMAGFEKELSDHVTIDLSGTYYVYPSAGSDNYFDGTATATVTHGNASASLGISYIPPQRATRDEDGHGQDNVYVFGSTDYAVPKTPLTLKAGLGYERGAFDEVKRGGKWDWTLGGEVEFAPARLGLAYVGSDADGGDRHAVVGSVFLSW